MSVDILKSHFDIEPDTSIQIGKRVRHRANDMLYTIVPVTHMEQETLTELYEMSNHMVRSGDKKVSVFLPDKNGNYLITHKNIDYVLLANQYRKRPHRRNTGRQLAKFHVRGKSLQAEISNLNRVGQWKDLWSTRLEQMEKEWAQLTYEHPREKFEKLFLETFPYYLGLCENAIQYVTDTELDERLHFSDSGTICHAQFRDDLWNDPIRDPFDWLFDHPARDIAEWIRARYFKNSRTFQPVLADFINGYQSIAPLSNFTWRLIYARLIFPLHYFACVEEYFTTNSQWSQKQLEERMAGYIRDSAEYELFLRNFFGMARKAPNHFPVLKWV